MDTNRAMLVVAPPSTLETNLITLRFAQYSYEATDVLFLWTSGQQHVEVICAMPDIRLRCVYTWLGYECV